MGRNWFYIFNFRLVRVRSFVVIDKKKSKKIIFYNVIFILVCGGIFLFLWNAPPETTPKFLHGPDHDKLYKIKKREAEKLCLDCHKVEGPGPIPATTYCTNRCFFCHKKDKK